MDDAEGEDPEHGPGGQEWGKTIIALATLCNNSGRISEGDGEEQIGGAGKERRPKAQPRNLQLTSNVADTPHAASQAVAGVAFSLVMGVCGAGAKIRFRSRFRGTPRIRWLRKAAVIFI